MSDRPALLLLVDDDPVFTEFVRQLVRALHREFPCATRHVDTAERAMTELRRIPHDLVLLDYHLPGADGLQVLEAVRALPSEQQPAVIMLTGSGSESLAVEAMKRGARDYLCKDGLDVAPLLRALRGALRQKRLADQLAQQDARMRADIEMARHLQRSLLPDRYPVLPRNASPEESALRFVHRFIPAAELAGDFFCVAGLSDTLASVFMCDVMGHGVRSALVAAMLRALVENEAMRIADPGMFLTALNRRFTALVHVGDTPLFATAVVVVVDAAHGRLRHASAGHPRPLHLCQQADRFAPLSGSTPPGPALGLEVQTAYTTLETGFAPGDAVLIFTDGLFEVPSRDGLDDYGRERLLAAANHHRKRSGAALCDALIDDARQFGGGAEFADDVCLLHLELAGLVRAPERSA